MLNWNTKVKASSSDRMDGVQKIILRGVLIDNTVNENNWQILEKDLPDIAAQSVGIQLRVDHSENVRDVKGQILSAELDEPHDFDKTDWDPAIDVPHIHYEAELVTDDASVAIPVMQGYVDHVSIGATHAVWPNMSAINYDLFVSGSSRFYSGGTTGVNINAIPVTDVFK